MNWNRRDTETQEPTQLHTTLATLRSTSSPPPNAYPFESKLLQFSRPPESDISLGKAFDIYHTHLTATNKAPTTIGGYFYALGDFYDFIYLKTKEDNYPLWKISTTDVADYMASVLQQSHYMKAQTLSANTAHNRYRALRTFFNWAALHDYIIRSPMIGLRAPINPIQPIPVLTSTEFLKLLAVCMGEDLHSRRDMAILMTLYDTGIRRAELISMTLDLLDYPSRSAIVMGKGRRARAIYFGENTAKALDLYMERRTQSEHFDNPNLWIGHHGALTSSGLYKIIKTRAAQAGVSAFPHQLRHTNAHEFLVAGGGESDLSTLLGWTTPAPIMLQRYAASASRIRAKQAHHKFGPGDRL
jgi:site-specific recombinase XerD